MATAPSIPELADVVERGSTERRAEALRKLTTLFLEGSSRFNEEHIRVFDEVFLKLIAEIEGRARQELARRLAPIGISPQDVIRRLAKDDDIMVAGPVLAQSPRLLTADLVEIASTKGPDHLYAISTRSRVEQPVSDLLVRRGDFGVKRKLAANPGAEISDSSFNLLLRSAEQDSVLAETVALRSDIPDHLFRELLTRATEVVQQRLLAKARPETQAEVRRVLAKVSGHAAGGRPATDFSDSQERVRGLAHAGSLSEAKLADIAQQQSYEDTVAALSEMTSVPVDVVDRLMSGERPDPILILCKAFGYGWPTVRAIILARRGSRGKTDGALETASANFDKLSAVTAERVVRFWQLSPGQPQAASAGLAAAG
jgi:uncharacterized protein (DUF2336 family)